MPPAPPSSRPARRQTPAEGRPFGGLRVTPAPGPHRYRVELRDVSFGDRDGYDFRINVKGSKEDLWVTSVTVEKLPEVRAEPHDPLSPG